MGNSTESNHEARKAIWKDAKRKYRNEGGRNWKAKRKAIKRGTGPAFYLHGIGQ